jgi:hypothetical protein
MGLVQFISAALHFILWSIVFRKSLTLLQMWKIGFTGDETTADLTQIRPMFNPEARAKYDEENDDDDNGDDNDIEADDKRKKNYDEEVTFGSQLTQGSDSIRGYAVYKKNGWSLETQLNMNKRSSSPPLPRTLQQSKINLDNNIKRSKSPLQNNNKLGKDILNKKRSHLSKNLIKSSPAGILENSQKLQNKNPLLLSSTFPKSGSLVPSPNHSIIFPNTGILKPELKSTLVPSLNDTKKQEESKEECKIEKEITREDVELDKDNASTKASTEI